MKNDKGCLWCLPSVIAPIAFGISNMVILIVTILMDASWPFILIPIIGSLPFFYTFYTLDSTKNSRLVLLIVYIIESSIVLVIAFILVFNATRKDECRNDPQ